MQKTTITNLLFLFMKRCHLPSNFLKYNKQKNLDMIRSKIETEDVLLSITKNCERLIKHTQRKAEKTLELKLTKSRQKF